MRDKLELDVSGIEEVNALLTHPDNPLINEVIRIVEKYGSPEEINAKARAARELSNLMQRLRNMDSPYVEELEWLISQRDNGAFVPLTQYRRNVLGAEADAMYFEDGKSVTLEISALQYFPWLITEAKQAIEHQEVMPGRYIRVRKMKEQEADKGDILAVAAAMQIIGASYVEALDTRGTDGSNIHLGGPETITGYFGGIGQPNEHPLMWIDELLYYYTNYGIAEVLNINPGTVFLGHILHKLGIDISFKISVFMGNDNPYAILWTLMMARLLARGDSSTSLVGFNVSNSVNSRTLELSSEVRRKLGLEGQVRIEHHITECYTSIVRQPYLRREQLLEIADTVPNISAKHEGGEPDVESTREKPSSILHYFRDKTEIEESGDMVDMEQNFMDKHQAVNNTARALTEKGFSFICAQKLHRR